MRREQEKKVAVGAQAKVAKEKKKLEDQEKKIGTKK